MFTSLLLPHIHRVSYIHHCCAQQAVRKRRSQQKGNKGKEEPETIKVKMKAKTKQSWTERKKGRKVDGVMYICV